MRLVLGQAFIALGGPQPRIICLMFGVGAWFATFFFTFDSAFASIASRHFFANRFKIGLRFLAWCVRYGWPKKQVAHDPLFICTLFLTDAELVSLAKSVNKRRQGVPLWLVSSDLICIYANLAHAALLKGDKHQYSHWHALHAREAEQAFPQMERVGGGQRRLAQIVGQQARFVAPADADLALRDFASACERLGTEWFVVSGTLLGVVREGDWLAHDYDIDVGIMVDRFPGEILIEELTRDGSYELIKFDRQVRFFTLADSTMIEEVPSCIKLVHRTGVPIDIFIHHREEETCWHGSAINRWNNSKFELVPYSFRGHTVLGPRDFDRYLTENYGDWRVPVKNFHSTDGSGTPNLVLVRNLFVIGLGIKRMVSVNDATRRRLAAMMVDLGAILVKADGGWAYNTEYCRVVYSTDEGEARTAHEFS